MILDSTFLIALERRSGSAIELLDALEASSRPLRVPAAAWVEYLAPMSAERRVSAMDRLDATATFEPFTRELADAAARMQHALAREGVPLGWHDLQIAATALVRAETLVTNDAAFQRVAGLDVLGH